jgi:Domain of unknown function (DUF6484)
MKPIDDPFVALEVLAPTNDFKALEQRSVANIALGMSVAVHPLVAKLHGFDLLEQPVVGQLACLPGQVVTSRSAVPLKRAMVGRDVLLAFEAGDVSRPIIIGVLEPHPLAALTQETKPFGIESDGERHIIEAEREIVLRCGDASITLTRAGKVLINGNYILSRSTGYNKLKGSAVDIN